MIALLLAIAALPHLTPDGWGKVRIGMTQAEVAKALGAKLRGEPIDSETACVEKVSRSHPGMWFMFSQGRLSRISVDRESGVATPRGIRPGATADEVRRRYGAKLEAEPHHYLDLPAEYLTYWTRPKERGVRFETDLARGVETIHAGNEDIQLIEGCA